MAAMLLEQFRDAGSILSLGQDMESLRERCRSAVSSALDESWPRRFRINELERIANQVCSVEMIDTPKLPVLDQVFDELMVRDGDVICYRPQRVQSFSRVASEIDPTLVVCWDLAGWLHNISRPSIVDVERVMGGLEPLFAPGAEPNRPVADNHVHLGGVSADDFVLSRHLLSRAIDDRLSDREALLRVRELLRLFVTSSADDALDAPDTLSALRYACRPEIVLFRGVSIDWWIVSSGCRAGNSVNADWLRAQLARAMQLADVSASWRWLVLLMWYLYRSPSATAAVRVAILYVFNEISVMRRRLVTDGQGLRRFTDRYYRAELRKSALDDGMAQTRDTIRRLFRVPGDRAELKISPDAFQPAVARRLAFAKGLGRTRERWAESQWRVSREPRALDADDWAYLVALESWHFCVHFLRRPSSRDVLKPLGGGTRGVGRRSRRAELWTEAVQLQRKLGQAAGWNGAAFLGGTSNLSLDFVPSRWLRGLDVAGDESAWPIEYFAPSLRWLRQQPGRLAYDVVPASGFHFSIHAGEDYTHPLSGLRHVDETVNFCEMRGGDRLGHALALGIVPAKWLARHGEVLIPVDEHLDNLVWAWHHATEMALSTPLAAQILPRLEQRIGRFTRYVKWVSPGATPSELIKAWQLRRNCPYQLFATNARFKWVTDRVLAGVPDHRELLAASRLEAGEVELPQRMYLSRAAAEQYPEVESRLVLLRAATKQSGVDDLRQMGIDGLTTSSLLEDRDLPEEVEFMEALQDFLLTRYAALGLVIEANPSSNVYIARLESHSEHPIFRWNPPDPGKLTKGEEWNRFGLRRGAIPVLINTDDPGIMPTTLRMEFELMREAAVDLGNSRSTAEDWIEGIRLAGVRHFEVNHVSVFGERNFAAT